MLNRIKNIIKHKGLWKHIALIALTILLFFFLVNIWLKSYTLHGQKLKTEDYIGQQVNIAKRHAKSNTFQMVTVDSVFVVGRSGGEILRQTPLPGHNIKEDRKIYVTITKYDADKIKISQLPILYGKDFSRKKRELKQGYELNSEIAGYRYDPGAADHILMVIYGKDTIVTSRGRKENYNLEKGSKLKFVLSKSRGGLLEIPDLLCKTYSESRFLLESYNVNIQVFEDGGITDLDNAFVWRQTPAYRANATIEMGSKVELYLTQYAPSFCPESDTY